MNLNMNSNVETLVTLAKYFRGAMMDEVKLPEYAVTIPEIVKTNGFKMMKISDKAKHYHGVVEEIEKSLEIYALQLNALMPQAIPTQKKLNLEDKATVPTTPARVKDTKTEPVKKEKALVDAESNIKKEIKENNPDLPTYGSLLAMPKGSITVEDATSIVELWKIKGTDSKTKVYNKVRKLLNNNNMSINTLRKDISLFLKKQKTESSMENESMFQKELDEAGIQFNTTTDLNKIISGEKLTTGTVKWCKEDSDEFNVLLLTDSDDEDKVDPQNYVKLWAIHNRVIGKENQAIDIITKFYSDKEKGILWSEDKARWFLNNVVRVNKFKELTYAVENMFISKLEAGNYEDAIPFAKSFLINYSKHAIEVERVIDHKKTKVKEFKYWPMHKVENFINRVVTGLRMSNLLKEVKPNTSSAKQKFKAEYEVNKRGKYMGKIIGDKTSISITNYSNLKDFEKACNVIAVSQAKMVNEKYTEKDIIITYIEKKGKADNKVITKSSTKKRVIPKDKVAVQTKSTNTVIDKAKTTTDKVVQVIKNKVNKDVKKPLATGSTKIPIKALKQAKKAPMSDVTKSNDNKKTMPSAKPSEKPQYSAIITLEKDKTYSCVINGFNEVIKTTGAKTVEEVKTDFIEALQKYNTKVMYENDRARANFDKKKGKVLHMKPDFTKGELTFLLKTVKTGTNG